ncbi:MAG: L,D-transpeptidase family protein, partial [Woeseia sp.]
RYVLPAGPRTGVVLNLAEYRMYYYPKPKPGERAIVMTFPISIGRMDWETPLGLTRVVAKARNPAWYPPESVRAEHEADGRPLPRIVPPGPDNPLGNFAMRLSLPGYLIHGTNRPAGVGMRVTHGCIRMFPEDIEYLFEQLSVETPVRIINEPLKVGWDGEVLVLEVHRTLSSAPPDDVTLADVADVLTANAAAVDAQLNEQGEIAEGAEALHQNGLTELTAQFIAATQDRQGAIDWEFAERQLIAPNGIPRAIGRSIKNAATSAAFE